jgi:hypothetical protein
MNPLNVDLFRAELSRGAAVVEIKLLAKTSVMYNIGSLFTIKRPNIQ